MVSRNFSFKDSVAEKMMVAMRIVCKLRITRFLEAIIRERPIVAPHCGGEMKMILDYVCSSAPKWVTAHQTGYTFNDGAPRITVKE